MCGIVDRLNEYINSPKIIDFKKGICSFCGKKNVYLLNTVEIQDKCVKCMELARDNANLEIETFKEWKKKQGAKVT